MCRWVSLIRAEVGAAEARREEAGADAARRADGDGETETETDDLKREIKTRTANAANLTKRLQMKPKQLQQQHHPVPRLLRCYSARAGSCWG